MPFLVREELNRRLRDGETGKVLVGWLNALPEVREVVEALFGGKVIREQNLSDWRKGGYRDWLEREERLELTVRMGEEVAEEKRRPGRARSPFLGRVCAPIPGWGCSRFFSLRGQRMARAAIGRRSRG